MHEGSLCYQQSFGWFIKIVVTLSLVNGVEWLSFYGRPRASVARHRWARFGFLSTQQRSLLSNGPESRSFNANLLGDDNDVRQRGLTEGKINEWSDICGI